MEPSNMIITYYSDKKLPKADTTTIKKTEDLKSLAQKLKIWGQLKEYIIRQQIFYLWGFLRDHVYENRPQSIAELKVAITQKIHAIGKENCVKTIDNFARRLQVCLRHNGGQLEHVL